ncbi:MAG: hypothetical protein DRP42_00815 [Tenericutes bacterium]|nr:MAG: hypothetical protein DRP42_00815 [Mycoplasmatota bacterium]
MILSPAIIATVLFLSLYKMTMDKIFPTSSKMELSIIAQNHSEIVDHFNEIGFHRTHTKQKITGGYSKEEKIVLKYIVTATEMRDLVKEVQSVSPNAFITINVLQNIYGNFVLRSKTIHETGRDKKLNKKKAKAEAKLEKQANAHQEKKLVKTKTVIMKHVPKSKARAASKSKKTNQKTSKAKPKTTKK